MTKKKDVKRSEMQVSATIDELLQAALEQDGESLETGRYIVTFKEGAVEEGLQSLDAKGLGVVNAANFEGQAVTLQDVKQRRCTGIPGDWIRGRQRRCVAGVRDCCSGRCFGRRAGGDD